MEDVGIARPAPRAHPLAMVEASGTDPATAGAEESSPMAVSIAGVSTACTKDALASSAKAVREALSTD